MSSHSHKRARTTAPDVEEKYSQDDTLTPGNDDATEETITVNLKYRGKMNPHEPPLLAHFPSGVPFPLTQPSSDPLPFHIYQSNDTTKNHRLLTCHIDDMEYISKNYGDTNYVNQPIKYVIGLFDTARNTLKLQEINHLYTFQQTLTTRESQQQNIEGAKNYADARDTLIETFGSRKRKRQLKAQAANQVQLETSTSDVLNHVLDQQVEVLQSEAETMAAIKSAYLPVYHPDATEAKDVYRLEDILSPEELLTIDIKPWLKLVKKPSWSQSEKDEIPSCLQHILTSQTKRIGNDKERLKHMVTSCKVLELLVNWMLANRKFKYKALMQLPCSELIKDRLIREFMESKTMAGQTRYEFSSTSETRLYCYIVIVTLLACSLVIDEYTLEALSGWLKINVTETVGYFKEIGCGSATKQGVKLSLPLRFIPFRKAKKAKDKK